jgi:glycosyltransferase involved in cell wall biosynthesis
MRISVVINTYNRGHCLGRALDGLDRQTHADFEVIVVDGPSTDGTADLLARHAGRLRVGRCPEVNISMSRNIGIDLAAGDVVAFLDDDAVPEPRWLEELEAAYADPDVGGVGGATYDYTGRRFQFRNGVANRLGEAIVNLDEPAWAYQIPGADPFACLLGANSSFRTEDLLAIGGFDEEIEYYLDETDICVRLNDRGRVVKSVDRAFVHHHYQPGHLRDERRIIRHPFPVVKNKLYFALTHGRPRYAMEEILADARRLADKHKAQAGALLSRAEMKDYLRQIEQGLERGLDRGLRGARRSGVFRPREQVRRDFLPYPTKRPEGRRLCICLVSQEYPPEAYGGIGRFTHDMAAGLAEIGHEVHVITAARGDQERTDYDAGVWIHRVHESSTARPELTAWPVARRNLNRATAVHAEVRRLAEDRVVDLVQAPIWDCEGVLCQLDGHWTSVLSLQTTAAIAATLNPAWGASAAGQGALALERFTVRHADRIHTISEDILGRVERDHGIAFDRDRVGLVPLGLPDRSVGLSADPSRPPGAPVRVLFVGRLEKRKGIDVFLEAAARVARRRNDVEFHVVGDDTLPAADGRTYRERFEADVEPRVRERFRFSGRVEEGSLYGHYAGCDIFCAPSRYESFGLIFVEAMMFARPVIGCRAGGVPEVVEHEGNGLLVPPDDPGALADAIERLVADPDLRARMGRRSRERYLERFTREAMSRRIEAFYRKMIA